MDFQACMSMVPKNALVNWGEGCLNWHWLSFLVDKYISLEMLISLGWPCLSFNDFAVLFFCALKFSLSFNHHYLEKATKQGE